MILGHYIILRPIMVNDVCMLCHYHRALNLQFQVKFNMKDVTTCTLSEGGGGLEYELIFMDGSDFIFLFGIIVPKLELKKYFYVFFFVKKIYLILCQR